MVRADSILPSSFIQHITYFNSITGSHHDIHLYLLPLLWLKDMHTIGIKISFHF